MRDTKLPTEESLRELYQAAIDFKKLEPWRWLWDADLICVENPKDKSLGYCSVMGKGGEHFALGVYLGDQGFAKFNEMMENPNMPPHQVVHLQDCLMCSFEDREDLASEDRKEIKALGLTFRGRNAWPSFRRYEPGFYPWFINQEECVFLTQALRQVMVVAKEIASGQLQVDFEEGYTITRYSKKVKGQLEWFNKEGRLSIPRIIYSPIKFNDELLIQRLKRAGKTNLTFQVDASYMPSPIQETKGERPFYPRVFVVANRDTGFIDFEMYPNIADDANVALNKLISLFLEQGLPKEIQVRGRAMVNILEDFCQKTGIKLKEVPILVHIDELMEELSDQY